MNAQLWIWGIFNFLIGVWEVYAFLHRRELKVTEKPFWNNTGNFWLDAWSEYCKADDRYIMKPYVWSFELINAFLSIIFLYALITGSQRLVKLTLLFTLLNCLAYFTSLFYERLRKTDDKLTRYDFYLFISSLWILVPWYLLKKFTN